jgi:large subunit ribosomal protein L28
VRTPRRFGVNVQDRRYWVPSLGRHVRLRLSTKGIRTVDRDGIDAVVARLRAAGERV